MAQTITLRKLSPGLRDSPWADSVRKIWMAWLATRIVTFGFILLLAVVAGDHLSVAYERWDAGWFLHIAEHGYGDEPHAPAFYPLYPLLLGLGGDALGEHNVIAGIILSFPLTLAIFALMFAVARIHVGEQEAHRAVMYLALFPTAFFFLALYSEALFVVLAIGAFLAAERRKFSLGALLAGAALLTRPLGIAVVAGLVVFALRVPDRRAALSRVMIAPLVFTLYPLLLVLDGRGPLSFLSAEAHWRQTSWDSVLRGPYLGVRAAWTGLRDLAVRYDYVALVQVSALLALVLFTVLSILAWRRLGAPYGVYCLLSLAMPAAAPANPWPLVSMQRFVLALFPCFIVLATLPIGKWAHRLLLGTSALTMFALLVYWTRGDFVA